MTLSLIRAANQFQFMTRGLATFEAQVARDVVLEAQEVVEADRERTETAKDIAVVAEQGSVAAKDIAAGYASDALSGGMDPGLTTVAGIAGLSIPVGITHFNVSGYHAAGDGGGHQRVLSTSSGPDAKQSLNGRWWAVAPAGGVFDVLAFGADNRATGYSNAASRKAFAAAEANGGGTVYFPAGDYKFFREVDPNQPPATNTFNRRACFIAGDNTKLVGDGRDVTRLTFECPGQKAGSVDATQFYQFIAHGRGFEMCDITVQGDVTEAEFEFVPFWGSVNIPSIITHASRDGNIYGRDAKIHNCRLGGLRGMCYGTSIILGVDFLSNEVFLSNGVNCSGQNVGVNDNYFYKSETIESAGTGTSDPVAVAAGFTRNANIAFKDNTCVDCQGGALGGNTSSNPLAQTSGYTLTGNRIFNLNQNVTTAITIANNALDVTINDDIIIGRFTNAALSISNSGLVGLSPGNVQILGGYYQSIGSGNGAAAALNIGISENEVHVLGGTFRSDGPFGVRLASVSPAVINLITANLIAQYGYGFGTGHTAKVNVSKKIAWTPTTAGNVSQIASGLAALPTTVLKPLIERLLFVSETDANQIVEQFRRQGGALTDDRFAHFIRYGTGRMGWGDPTKTSVFPDVYLDRKADKTLGLDSGNAFRLGTTTTAARPTANVVGEGAMMWDTTLKMPIWSNGTAWVNASGTAV